MESSINASTTATSAGNVSKPARLRKLTFDGVNSACEHFLIAAGLALSIAAFLM
jgi:hypothetical protein